ncbi:tRNA adenosine(34) deaminase TadA [Brevibacterium ammoniilyticum]|uniref:tRNA-specific adenosine deaminase n=1 Tax=Brevibacterium ammoniilyticum TaxID=1046555 RepID=A0ABP9U0I0_9MICO
MALALAEAAEASRHDDVPVGALVLDGNGRIIGTGHNRREIDADPLGHAELIALRSAAEFTGRWRLDGCTLVVTLEPCVMCAGAIVGSRIARLVYGAFDDKAGAVGSVWDIPRDRASLHHPEVYAGVQASACAALLSDFFAAKRA